MIKNCIIDTDYYKTTHGRMYNPTTKGLFSYAESRGGIYDTVVFFGLQHYIKSSLLDRITRADVDYAEAVIQGMNPDVPFDRKGWDIIVAEHGGYLPVTIKAVKEGTKVPVKNALVTVESNDPRIPWLTSYIETALIRLWYPTTIASKSYAMRKGIKELYSRYADTTANVDFALLDFGSRGVEGYEANAIGGAAFLTSFLGTDSVPAVSLVLQQYGGRVEGFSVPATEHSVMCSWGKTNELESFRYLLEEAKPNSTISVVSDTWDIYKACEYWNSLAHIVYEKNLTLVVRPDSGDPVEVLPAMLEILSKGFKTRMNDKGLKVFENLKLLWGDGISEQNYLVVLGIMPANGYGVENLMLGSGGGLLQNVNRDTMKFAFKASAILTNIGWTPIAKAPITDPGKKSKPGRLMLIKTKDTGEFATVDESLAAQLGTQQLEVVYKNGSLLRDQTMTEIRELVNA